MGLFGAFEERPPACRAVLVWFDTVDLIAQHYVELGYETTLKRRPDGIELSIQHEASEQLPAFHLHVVIDHHGREDRQYLVHDRPPYLVPADEFERKWRPMDVSKQK